jgi:hypothetical protein
MRGLFLLLALLSLLPSLYELYYDRKREYLSCTTYEGTCIAFLSQCREVVVEWPIQSAIILLVFPRDGEYSTTHYLSLSLVVVELFLLLFLLVGRIRDEAVTRREARLHKKYGGEKHKRKRKFYL